MAGVLDILFQKQTGIFEVVLCQIFHRLIGAGQFVLVPAHSHADTAAAGGAFQHERIPDSCRFSQRLVQVLQ